MSATQIAIYPAPTPTHFWPMNEGSGSTFYDHAVSGKINLAATNVSWQTTAGMGPNPVAAFNGSNAHAQAAAADPSLNFNANTPFSAAFWMVTSASTSESFFGNLDAQSGTYRGWELTTGGISGIGLILVNNLGTSDNVSYLDGTPQATLTPVFVMITYDGSNTLAGTKLYLNGVLTPMTASGVLSTPGYSSTIPFLVGSRNNGSNWFVGAMAFIRVWANEVLLQGHATGLFANGPQ
jgi:hypothetical protein